MSSRDSTFMIDSEPDPSGIFAQLATGKKFDVNDRFIAVMGVTGSGKSTFISRCTNGGAIIGHSLVSCTSEVEVFDFQYNNTTIHLIDTPGFDDTFRTDSDVLKDVAFWLNAAYQAKVKLSGIVYLHPIDKNRMTGSAHKNLRMFQKLCGDSSLKSVVLATTMWANVPAESGEKREYELKETPDFWGSMISQGSRVFRHTDDKHSAMNVVSYILDQHTTTVLTIQRQMVDEGKRLDETSAGQELEKELIKQREAFERRLKIAQEEMEEALEEGNRKAVQELTEQQDRFQKKIDEALKGSNDIKMNMQNLLEQKEKEYQNAVKQMELERQKTNEKSAEVSNEMLSLRRKMQARDEEAEENRRRHKKEIDEMNLRFSKQHMESQAELQKYISRETQKAATAKQAAYQPPAYYGPPPYQQVAYPQPYLSASTSTPARIPPPSFGGSLAAATGASLGGAALPLALTLAASACTVM